MANPHVVIEYDPQTQTPSWSLTEGFPIKDLLLAIELLKASIVNAQLHQISQQRQATDQPRIIVPSLQPIHNKGN